MVTANGKAGVCSGFIWKQGNWIVTSLHAMKPGGDIQVQYLDQFWRFAKIIRVNVEADLVLLQITEGDVPAGAIPLQAYSTKTLNLGDDIIAIGYNSGCQGQFHPLDEKGICGS